MASQRVGNAGQGDIAQLLGEVRATQTQIDAQLAQMPGDSLRQALENSRSLLSGIAQRLASGKVSAVELAQIASIVATASAANNAVLSTDAGASLVQAESASGRAVSDARDYLKSARLKFPSAEDERAYRDREKERNAYIASQPNTPTGHLNAAGATVGQMVDAKANGASGPEFEQKWNELVETTERLRAEAKAHGLSTEEFDQRLRDDLRRVMKSKGYTDAQIDAQFASSPDPLEAAKAFVKDSADIETLKEAQQKDSPKPAQFMLSITPQAEADAKALIASLKATGVVAGDVPKGAKPHHGTISTATDTNFRSV